METISLQDFGGPRKEGLFQFLQYCQGKAVEQDHAILASISLETDFLDPLAVLQTVNDTSQEHYYFEKRSKHTAVSAAEPVLKFESRGTNRFSDLRKFADEWLEHCVVIGNTKNSWSGPHFFTSFSFEEVLENEDFLPPVFAMLPRWQVGMKGNSFSATANLVVGIETEISKLIEPIWRAHERFQSFDFDSDQVEEAGSKSPLESTEILNQLDSESGFKNAVRSALESIRSGEAEKIVVSRDLLLRSEEGFQPLEALSELRRKYPECCAFSVQNAKGATLTGASPERLIAVKDGVFETEALAGSIERGDNARKDAHFSKQLLASEKDRAENSYVLDYLQQELQQLGLNVDFASVPEIMRLSNIQHLRVPLEGKLKQGMHILDVAERLHPTPALGGFPKKQALERIAEIEKRERGPYAGLTGWFDCEGNGEMIVNIRCAKVSGNEAVLYSGAGIVGESQVEKELQETELKLIGMLSSFVDL
ncbi:MAG: isochorismate synthase [Opitutales bacterium]|nr:isochorismate synthase [Opitutales bacterium]